MCKNSDKVTHMMCCDILQVEGSSVKKEKNAMTMERKQKTLLEREVQLHFISGTCVLWVYYKKMSAFCYQ